MKAVVAHHPIIQKELDELLVKDGIETSTGCASFYSMISFPFFILRDLIATCTYLHFRCLLSKKYSNSYNKMIMLSQLISRTLICILLLLSVIVIFAFYWGK